MIKHYYPNFLQDEAVYAQAEAFWLDLWEKIDADSRDRNGWRTPWFEPLPPSISEGNPIFSAISPSLRRGIRILQYEPSEKGVEFFAYPDTFGGTSFDPSAIQELVISCALSDSAAEFALSLMCTWVAGDPIQFELAERAVITRSRRAVEELFYDMPVYLPAA